MHDTTRRELDLALEYRETTPGLTQEALIELVSEQVHGDPAYLNPNSPVGLVIYQVYLGGIEAASMFSMVTLAGVDVTEGY